MQCLAVLGFFDELVCGRILPGAAVSLLVGNLDYAWQATGESGRSCRCLRPALRHQHVFFSYQASMLAVGRVTSSSHAKYANASAWLSPHISTEGLSPAQQAGRLGSVKISHIRSWVSCTQRTPLGLPLGIPGMGEDMDKAMQHAPQPGRQFMPNSIQTLRAIRSSTAR